VQGERPGHHRDRRASQRADGARRRRPQIGRSAANHRTAGEHQRRCSDLVGAVRPQRGRHLRDPGRDCRRHRGESETTPDRQ
jgi:hypothetical protein